GNYNSRENNCGDYNCGDSNSGNYNSGHCNSGHHNTGDYNSGHYNSGNHNSGYCNTNTPKVRMFNHVTDFDFDDKTITRFENILFNCPQSYKYSDFISISDMSEDEIIRHPECETIGGYIKTIIVEADKQKWWDEDVSDDDKEFIKSLPYFDAEIFYECVGIRIK
ncbi:pentapeptide repeat-containing protein, partial [Hominilimicola fabiformis]